MTLALSAAAILLCGTLALASVLVRLYGGASNLRKRPAGGTFARFAEEVMPRLGYAPENGQARFALVQFASLTLLSIDLFYLGSLRSALWFAAAEAMVLSGMAVVLCALVVPAVASVRGRGRWLVRLTWPARLLGAVAQPLLFLADFVESIAGVGADPARKGHPQRPNGEIDALLDAGQQEGLIDGEDRKLIHSVVDFGDKTVREVMTPRPRIVAIEATRSLADLRSLLREGEHSRIPVYVGNIDAVTGFVHSRDTLGYGDEELAAVPVGSIARPLALVPETKRIHELLREMQEAGSQMALVIDEYGQTAGLATMEDLMEEIVGEIRDETDPAHEVQPQPDESYIAQGSLDLDRLEELVGYRRAEDLESTTVGGFVCEELGRVPAAGAKVRLDGLELEVLAADGRRVDRVRFRRREPPPAAQDALP